MGSYSKRQTEEGWAEGATVWIGSNWIQCVDLWYYLSHNPKLFSNSQGQVERNATQEIVKGDWKLFFDKLIKNKLVSLFFCSLLLSQGTGCLFPCTLRELSKYLLIISRFQLLSWRWVLQSFSFPPFLSLQFSFQFCLGCSYRKLVIMEPQSRRKK